MPVFDHGVNVFGFIELSVIKVGIPGFFGQKSRSRDPEFFFKIPNPDPGTISRKKTDPY
jgi:hypothetical protein